MELANSSIMMDLVGTDITQVESEMLKHPLVGGVILFTRNFESSAQLIKLTQSIRRAAGRPILIGVDHEGGRVQRFKTDGFTHIPAMGKLDNETITGENIQDLAWLMASECLAHGIDLSFAPVLDLERGSDVVGDRAFSADVNKTVSLVNLWCEGMQQAGMARVGKHFPGHGSTKEDSHVAAPVDQRSLEELMQADTLVFKQVFATGLLDAVMPAHIQFSQVDDKPAGYSEVWLQDILKQQLGFNGVIFSDDLSMVGAGKDLTYSEKAQLALSAGCDMVLICNDQEAVLSVLNDTQIKVSDRQSKGLTLIANTSLTLSTLKSQERYTVAQNLANKINNKR